MFSTKESVLHPRSAQDRARRWMEGLETTSRTARTPRSRSDREIATPLARRPVGDGHERHVVANRSLIHRFCLALSGRTPDRGKRASKIPGTVLSGSQRAHSRRNRPMPVRSGPDAELVDCAAESRAQFWIRRSTGTDLRRTQANARSPRWFRRRVSPRAPPPRRRA
jgi:hypothetical protein